MGKYCAISKELGRVFELILDGASGFVSGNLLFFY